jgi:bifunctional UDP-N-acetylglucosamine pyrophosphorylase / glucosamine-1-phosphate N-acetyltransferase
MTNPTSPHHASNTTTPGTTPGTAAPVAIIMAAGKGTRMKSDLPKVAHPVGGRAMVCAVVDACLQAGCSRIVVVVGYGREHVETALAGYEGIRYAVQSEQLGTGHAVLCARDAVADLPEGTPVFVLAGDGPLIRSSTLLAVLDRHRSTGASATLATSVIEDPTGYGRVVRDAEGRFQAIVEQKNATDAQLAIREVNPSYYCFALGTLFKTLGRLGKDSVSGEYYITDVPAMQLADGLRVEVLDAVPPEDILSINTLEQLAVVDKIYRARQHSSGSGGGV